MVMLQPRFDSYRFYVWRESDTRDVTDVMIFLWIISCFLFLFVT